MKINGPKIKLLIREKGTNIKEISKQMGVSYSAVVQAIGAGAMLEENVNKLSEILAVPPAEITTIGGSASFTEMIDLSRRLGILENRIQALTQRMDDLTAWKVEADRTLNKLRGL